MKKMICLGDSLTEAADLAPGFAWPILLGNTLPIETANLGISGDTTGGMLARCYLEMRELRPDMVMIMGGTNDLWWGLDRRLVLSNIFAMARQARHLGVTPLIATPLPVDIARAEAADFSPPEDEYGELQAGISRLAEALLRESVGYEVPCVDFHGLFRDEGGEVIGDLFLDDGLHAGAEGHRRMAGLAGKILRDTFLFPE